MAFGASDASIFIQIVGDDDRLNRALNRSKREMRQWGREMSSLGSAISFNPVTSGMAAITVIAARSYAEYEKHLNRIEAVTGATVGQMGRLTGQAKELGKTTIFSAQQAAEGMAFLGMAGFDAEEVLKAMPGVTKLAAIGMTGMSTAADIATNILLGFGLEVEDIARVNDVMAAAITESNTDLRKLGSALSYAAPLAAAAGWSLEETTAAIMSFSDAGIQGTRAGTSVRNVLMRLTQETHAQKMFDAFGVSVWDSTGKVKDLDEIIQIFTPHMDEAGKMTKLFGARAAPGFLKLLRSGIGEFDEDLQNLTGSMGMADEMAEIMVQGFYGKMVRFKSAVSTLMIEIGDAVQGPLGTMADFFTNKVAPRISQLASWFEELPYSVQASVLAFVGLAASIGPVLWTLGPMLTAFTILNDSFVVTAVRAKLMGNVFAPLQKIFGGVTRSIMGLGVVNITSSLFDGLRARMGGVAAVAGSTAANLDSVTVATKKAATAAVAYTSAWLGGGQQGPGGFTTISKKSPKTPGHIADPLGALSYSPRAKALQQEHDKILAVERANKRLFKSYAPLSGTIALLNRGTAVSIARTAAWAAGIVSLKGVIAVLSIALGGLAIVSTDFRGLLKSLWSLSGQVGRVGFMAMKEGAKLLKVELGNLLTVTGEVFDSLDESITGGFIGETFRDWAEAVKDFDIALSQVRGIDLANIIRGKFEVGKWFWVGNDLKDIGGGGLEGGGPVGNNISPYPFRNESRPELWGPKQDEGGEWDFSGGNANTQATQDQIRKLQEATWTIGQWREAAARAREEFQQGRIGLNEFNEAVSDTETALERDELRSWLKDWKDFSLDTAIAQYRKMVEAREAANETADKEREKIGSLKATYDGLSENIPSLTDAKEELSAAFAKEAEGAAFANQELERQNEVILLLMGADVQAASSTMILEHAFEALRNNGIIPTEEAIRSAKESLGLLGEEEENSHESAKRLLSILNELGQGMGGVAGQAVSMGANVAAAFLESAAAGGLALLAVGISIVIGLFKRASAAAEELKKNMDEAGAAMMKAYDSVGSGDRSKDEAMSDMFPTFRDEHGLNSRQIIADFELVGLTSLDAKNKIDEYHRAVRLHGKNSPYVRELAEELLNVAENAAKARAQLEIKAEFGQNITGFLEKVLPKLDAFSALLSDTFGAGIDTSAFDPMRDAYDRIQFSPDAAKDAAVGLGVITQGEKETDEDFDSRVKDLFGSDSQYSKSVDTGNLATWGQQIDLLVTGGLKIGQVFNMMNKEIRESMMDAAVAIGVVPTAMEDLIAMERIRLKQLIESGDATDSQIARYHALAEVSFDDLTVDQRILLEGFAALLTALGVDLPASFQIMLASGQEALGLTTLEFKALSTSAQSDLRDLVKAAGGNWKQIMQDGRFSVDEIKILWGGMTTEQKAQFKAVATAAGIDLDAIVKDTGETNTEMTGDGGPWAAMIAAMETMFHNLFIALGLITQEFVRDTNQSLAGIEDVVVKIIYDESGKPVGTEVDPDQGDESGAGTSGLASGSFGKYEDYGTGTMMMLHGKERVMTQAEGIAEGRRNDDRLSMSYDWGKSEGMGSMSSGNFPAGNFIAPDRGTKEIVSAIERLSNVVKDEIPRGIARVVNR